jgi:hypothetical protein
VAQLFTTGPANLYVSISTLSVSYTMADLLTYPVKADIYFLGTCESKPTINILPSYRPLRANIGGSGHPFDHFFNGEVGIVQGTLNRWNEAIYQKLAARPNMFSGTRGSYSNKDIGRPVMMSGPGYAGTLWVQFPKSTAKSATYGTQPKAYRFPGAVLFGPDEIHGPRRSLTFWCGRVYKKTDGTWKVYDNITTSPDDVTNVLPDVPPITADGIVFP